MNRQAVARDWLARGYSCDVWIDPPGQCWENYVHAVDERVMVLEGEVEFEVNGTIHHPKPWETLWIPAGVRHSVRNRGRTTARWLYGYRTE